jgi:beta-lactamase class A
VRLNVLMLSCRGNLLLASFGGSEGLTAYARSLGDDLTRFDRIEPALDEATPGNPRDTIKAQAMLQTMRKTVLGDALSPASRAQLTRWLLANKTGDRKLRAKLPAGWRVGDKTGGGAYGTANDMRGCGRPAARRCWSPLT